MQAGQTLGSYRVLEPLGEGGMGEVYLAEDLRLGRQVAIKVLPVDVAGDDQALARLEQEARLLAQLEHPNVATVYGLEEAVPEGSSEVVRHLVMQVAEGEPLSARLATGALPREEAIEIARQIAAGVGAAHDKGIIHRDLKPANVMVADGPSGPVVKVLDFGLAKALEGKPARGNSDLTASPTMAAVTGAGVIMGTAAYMSPEQARGKPVDRRTDVWALGCLIYEMFTGSAAFEGETVSDIMAAILTKEPDWSALPALPPATHRALRRCLSADVDGRPYDVRDVVFDMAPAPGDTAPEGDVATVQAGPAAARMWPALAAIALLAAVAGYAVARFGSGEAALQTRSSVPGRHNQMTFQPGAEAFPSITADGDWIVYASRADGDWDIYLQSVGGDNPINLTEDSPEDDLMPSFSPDGRQIAFRSERSGGGIYLMGRTGESVRRLAEEGFNPSWAPDGTRIAVTTERIAESPYAREASSELRLLDIATGSSTRVPAGTDAVQASFSPDGNWVVYWGIAEEAGGQRDLWTTNIDTGEIVTLLDDVETDWTPVFTPDGAAVVFSSDRGGTPGLWQLQVDPTTRQPMGVPELIVPGNAQWIAYPAFARNTGQLLYAAMGADIQAYRVAFDLPSQAVVEGPEPLTSGARHAISPDISRDEQWITYASGQGQQEDIYIQRVDGSVTRRLTNDPFKDRSPRFSPDGNTLAFYAARDGAYRIWAIDIDGSNLRPLSAEGSGLTYTVWSPEGDRILTTRAASDRSPRMLTLAEAGAVETAVEVDTPPGTKFMAAGWSREGERIVGSLGSTVSGISPGVQWSDLQSGASTEVADFGWYPTWLNDDRHIAFRTADEIWVADTDTGELWLALSTSPARIVEYMSPLRTRPGVVYSARSQEDNLWLASWE